jgi:hypothetical protein
MRVSLVISRETVLIVSQDYELFFYRSGSVDKCLFEPCDALLASAARYGYRITFYVDAGMLVRMAQEARRHAALASDFDRIRKHLASIAGAGHDIGLHVHPHWEDARFDGSAWDFQKTRYRLGDFTPAEAAAIVRGYAEALSKACDTAVSSYRAGGFCVEPFDWISAALLDLGIDVDSSVVPGARLRDGVKGFDFRAVPGTDWWLFSRSPAAAAGDGLFLEIPVTPQKLPVSYYWRRLASRLASRPGATTFGDGSPKKIGAQEALRRLAGMSRLAETSIDEPKADELDTLTKCMPNRKILHVMGHPKNLSRRSLNRFEGMLESRGLERFENVRSAARLIRGGDLA